MRPLRRPHPAVTFLLLAVPLGAAVGWGLWRFERWSRPGQYLASMPAEVADALRSAESVELLALDSSREVLDSDAFHNWKVFGTARLETADRAAVADALIRDGQGGQMFMCFVPRHGVRATGPDGVVELVVCFECGHVYVHGVSGVKAYFTGSTAQPLLDRLLAAAGVTWPVRPGSQPTAR